MTVEIKKVITRDITLEFKNATNVNIFYIDINNNLQYAQLPRKVNNILIMSDFLVEVGHISNIKLKHIKNMIKFPDIVNIEEVIYYYNKLMNHISWTNLGVVTVGDVMSIGDIKGKPGLEDAKKLGASIK